MNYRKSSPLVALCSLTILVIGVVVALPHLLGAQTVNVRALTPGRSTRVEEPLISGMPSHIEVPSSHISIDVAPGYFDARSKTWTLSSDKAHFATVTSQPNNKTGNTFIYGHNRWQVFTGLLDAKIGDNAIISTENGHRFTYKLAEIVDVDPDDTSFMQPTTEPTLTLQTCSGIWYENRRMFRFTLQEVI